MMTDLEALTLTIWGEARGEPIEGKIGVAMVMRNRLLSKYRGALTYIEVCTAHAQFSAWTEESNQMLAEAHVLELSQHPDPVLQLCIEIAKATINVKLADNTVGANHYYADSIPAPFWAIGKPFVQLGSQKFLIAA
jgi:spore germination cell wall hydrolase CwlJ-like protein